MSFPRFFIYQDTYIILYHLAQVNCFTKDFYIIFEKRENMEIFCKRLRELRLEMEISTIKLAKALDVSSTAISRWENGKRTPNIEQLRKLALFFNVSSDYLLGLVDY